MSKHFLITATEASYGKQNKPTEFDPIHAAAGVIGTLYKKSVVAQSQPNAWGQWQLTVLLNNFERVGHQDAYAMVSVWTDGVSCWGGTLKFGSDPLPWDPAAYEFAALEWAKAKLEEIKARKAAEGAVN